MICPSCGAEYADWAQKCPYCGTVNEQADEQVYLSHMEELRERLGQTDEEAGRDYSAGIRRSSGKVLKRVAVIICIAAGISLAAFSVYKANAVRRERSGLERISRNEDLLPELDRLYAAGDYAAVLKIVESDPWGADGWEHFNFIFSCYKPWAELERCRNISTSALDPGTRQMLFFYAVSLFAITEDSSQKQPELSGLSPEEAAAVSGYRKSALDFFRDRLGLNEEEARELCLKCSDSGFVDWQLCQDRFAEVIWR